MKAEEGVESSTRNIMIGVGVAAAVCALFCCLGSAAFFFIAGEAAESVDKQAKELKKLDGAGERWPMRDFKSDYKAAKKAGWKLPRKPKNKKVEPAKADIDSWVTLGWNKLHEVSKFLTHSHERSAFVTAHMLAGGEPIAFAKKSGYSDLASPDMAGIYFGHFSNCGRLAKYEPFKVATKRGAGNILHDAEFSWVTESGCTIRVETRLLKDRDQNTFYVPLKVTMLRPSINPPWIVRLDFDTFKRSEARRIYKKHGREIAQKLRKARRAGMKAEHYYPAEPVGNKDLIRKVIPKAKIVSTWDRKSFKIGGVTYYSIGYKLRYDGRPLKYRIYYASLSELTGKKRDRDVYFMAGEALELVE